MAAMATDIGANPAFLLALQSMLDSATRRGYGQQDMAAIYEIF